MHILHAIFSLHVGRKAPNIVACMRVIFGGSLNLLWGTHIMLAFYSNLAFHSSTFHLYSFPIDLYAIHISSTFYLHLTHTFVVSLVGPRGHKEVHKRGVGHKAK